MSKKEDNRVLGRQLARDLTPQELETITGVFFTNPNRDVGLGNVQVEIIPTPPDVEKAILAFARKAQICFGSVDFAVDNDGQWWFLEINEQGQFLSLDQFNAQAKTLEKFCAFITAPEGSTQPLEEREHLFPCFSEFIEVYRSMPENQQPIDIAAAVAASPYMSRETGRSG
jgi:hypothetical protein